MGLSADKSRNRDLSLRAERQLKFNARRAWIESQLRKVREVESEAVRSAPHLYLHKHYEWSRSFFESENRLNFLCAGNQVGKSTVNIRRCLHLATDEAAKRRMWPKAYELSNRPNLFWYLYPSADVAESELESKWKQYLILEDKNSPFYCKVNKKPGAVKGLSFPNADHTILFKYYGQDRINLQSNTVYAIFADEEIPIKLGHLNLVDELMARLTSVDGIFHMVFTATLAQEYWRRVIEERGDNEIYPNAFKRQVSLYDCLQYEDGDTHTPWTRERINEVKALYSNDSEIQNRVYGRFVKGVGLVFHGYNRERNLTTDTRIGEDWNIYAGVDIGSGGHRDPAAVAFVAANPQGTEGKIIKVWRGGIHQETSVLDIYKYYVDHLRKWIYAHYKKAPFMELYDPSSRDFGIIARERGTEFQIAINKKEVGIELFNSLMKFGMLKIVNTPESGTEELISEFHSCTFEALKRKAHRVRDLGDAVRYALMAVTWDFSENTSATVKQEKLPYKRGPNQPDAKLYGTPQERREYNAEYFRKKMMLPEDDTWYSNELENYTQELRDNYEIF